MEFQHNLIISEAKRRSYKINDISFVLGPLANVIEKGNKSEFFFEGTPLSLINLQALKYFDNKQLTKVALSKLDIPYPKSILFNHPKDDSLKEFFEPEKAYVCKPPDMTEGIGVEMNIVSLEAIEDYWNRNQKLGPTFMLEEQIQGKDLRVQVIGGKVVAACTREPAFVIGDGENDLNFLIEKHQLKVEKQNPSNNLIIDELSFQLIDSQNFKLNSIPENGQKVQLKELANMSQGAVAIDVTEKLHPNYQKWTSLIANYLNVEYFAIDFIAENFNEDPNNQAIILEINAKPEWVHHTFSEGKQHDIAEMVLDHLFEAQI